MMYIRFEFYQFSIFLLLPSLFFFDKDCKIFDLYRRPQ